MTEAICFNMPGRLSQCTASFTGYPACQFAEAASFPHSTAMRRSGSYIRLVTFGHALECTATPFPRVTYPTISSPRIGLQHCARYTSRSSCPVTMMADVSEPNTRRITLVKPPVGSLSGSPAPDIPDEALAGSTRAKMLRAEYLP